MEKQNSDPPHTGDSPFHSTPTPINGLAGVLALTAVALVLNALFHPYLSLTHDSRLYALQSLNHLLNGSLNGDLYFQFSSQDSYSIFTRMLAPGVATLGLQQAYLLFFLAGKFFLFFALAQFLLKLIGNNWTTIIACLALSIFSIPLLEDGTLAINEAFLTPRLYAISAALFGLQAYLSNRIGRSLLSLLAALLLHPIMAFPAICIIVIDLIQRRLKIALTLLITVLTLLATALLPPALISTLGLPELTPEWLQVVELRAPFNLISTWPASQWISVLAVFPLFPAAALLTSVNTRSRQFLFSALITTAAGLTASWIAESSSLALLLQGQFYRALWLYKLTGVVCAILLLIKLYQDRSPGAFCMGLCCLYLCLLSQVSLPLTSILLDLSMLGAFGFYYRCISRSACSDWLKHTLVSTLAVTVLIQIGILVFRLLDQWTDLIEHSGIAKIPFYISASFDYHLQLLALAVAVLLFRRRNSIPILAAGAALLTFSIHFIAYHFPFHSVALPDEQDHIKFAKKYIKENHHEPGPAQVYWPYHSFELHHSLLSTSYFGWQQVAGVIFSEQLAAETRRRAKLVQPFEISYSRHYPDYQFRFKRTDLIFQNAEETFKEPEAELLLQLCKEPTLDFIFLHLHYEGYVADATKTLYAYHCDSMRGQT